MGRKARGNEVEEQRSQRPKQRGSVGDNTVVCLWAAKQKAMTVWLWAPPEKQKGTWCTPTFETCPSTTSLHLTSEVMSGVFPTPQTISDKQGFLDSSVSKGLQSPL